MKTEDPITLFPLDRDWPEGVRDIASVHSEEGRIRLVTGPKGWHQLRRFVGLKALWCFDVNSKSLGYICGCPSLENLYIETLRSDQTSRIRELTFLKVLSIDSWSQVNSLSEFGTLDGLQGLAITNFKNLHEIDPLAKLINLQQLAIAGSMWTRMKIESLGPLSSLQNLRYLHLTNVKPADSL